MIIKKGFVLLEIKGESEEILMFSDSESELKIELEKYNAKTKFALEEYTKTLSEINSYFQKYEMFYKTIGYSESRRGALFFKRQDWFKHNPIPESIKNYFYLDGEYLLYTVELEYPAVYIIRKFGENE